MSERICRGCAGVIPSERATQARYCSLQCTRRAGKRRYNKAHRQYFKDYRKQYMADPLHRQRKIELQIILRNKQRMAKPSVGKRAAAIKRGFRSWFEVELHDFLKKEKANFEYETEKLSYILDCQYVPDFILKSKKDGHSIYIEAKGRFDQKARRKMAAVKVQHPGLDIRIIFSDANQKISKGSKTTNAMWAKKNGFPWAHKYIPKAWIAE